MKRRTGKPLILKSFFKPEKQNTISPSALPTGILIFVVGDRRFKVLKE